MTQPRSTRRRQSRHARPAERPAPFITRKLVLHERLVDLQARHACIGDVRGRGLMLAIEFVSDRKAKTPDRETTSGVFEECRKQGLILSKSGPHQSVLRMVPPLCLSMADVDAVADGLDAALTAATR